MCGYSTIHKCSNTNGCSVYKYSQLFGKAELSE
nr:MAG TPA: hypothetical protein [Caudoviricetes sp.]